MGNKQLTRESLAQIVVELDSRSAECSALSGSDEYAEAELDLRSTLMRHRDVLKAAETLLGSDWQTTHRQPASQHRLLRVIEYVGTPEFIRDCIEKRAVKGEYLVPKYPGRIREALIGETAEVLTRCYADGFTSPEDTPIPLEG